MVKSASLISLDRTQMLLYSMFVDCIAIGYLQTEVNATGEPKSAMVNDP